ncbi:LAFE_0G19130g1_1 [Lachancea fermentati]|uniref:LAFE_0G19130g1_1 n=1 Tax=Lachancea fermentati TaxID=4955 RepID=A0A1G4MJ24_LACFM|nr:LAFE_0G19130g1_1 [Lachancea fermentati]
MRSILQILLFIITGSTVTHARNTERKTKWNEIMTMACFHELSTYKWDTSESRRKVLCNFSPALSSWVYCSVTNYRVKVFTEDLDPIFKLINGECGSKWPKDEDFNLDEILSSATKNIKEKSEVNDPIDSPVIPDSLGLQRWIIALFGPVDNLDKGTIFAGLISGFWAIILAIGAFSKTLKRLNFRNSSRSPNFAWIKAKITSPPLFQRHAAYFGKWFFIGLIPTRLETITILIYVLFHTLFMTTNYHFDKLQLFSTLKIQTTLFVSDRAGIIAFAQLPFIILSGGRNHIVQSITGIKFKTMISFHKWAGRLMFLDVLTHGLGYIYLSYAERYTKYVWDTPVWRYGRLGVYSSIALVFFSFYFFRRHFYETFLFVHYLMAMVFIIACWKHCSQIGWMEWVYASIAIWVLEFIVRAYRCVKFGFPHATFELFGDEFIKITIPKTNHKWLSKPGQYAYIYILKPSIFWQSHPFTILEISDDSNEPVITIIASVKNGFTKDLKMTLEKESPKSYRVAIEGPYGEGIPYQNYDNVLLLGGGTGVISLVSIALSSVKSEIKSSPLMNLVWSLKSDDLLSLYQAQLSKLLNHGLDLDVYLTSSPPVESFTDLEMMDMSTAKDKLLNPTSKIQPKHYGRPDLEKIISEFEKNDGSLLIVTCGPPSFVDSVRRLTCKKINCNPTKVIDYEEDYQIW